MSKLRLFERMIFKSIFEAVSDAGDCRVRSNQRLDELISLEDIVRFTKSRKFTWLGRVNENNGWRNVFNRVTRETKKEMDRK